MLQGEIFIWKPCCPVDRTGSCTIAVDKISSLYHEILDLSIQALSADSVITYHGTPVFNGGFRYILLGETCYSYSPVVALENPCSHPCRTDENSPLSEVLYLQIIPF